MNRTVNTLCYHINIKTDGLGNIVPAARYASSLVRALLQLSCSKENRSISQCLFKGVSGCSNRRLCDSLDMGVCVAGYGCGWVWVWEGMGVGGWVGMCVRVGVGGWVDGCECGCG